MKMIQLLLILSLLLISFNGFSLSPKDLKGKWAVVTEKSGHRKYKFKNTIEKEPAIHVFISNIRYIRYYKEKKKKLKYKVDEEHFYSYTPEGIYKYDIVKVSKDKKQFIIRSNYTGQYYIFHRYIKLDK